LCEHEQVRAYERALGGEPPRAAQRKSQSELTRYLAQRLTLQRTNIELKRIHEQRIKRKLARPALRKFEPRVITGSNFAFHAPPYDVAYTFNPSGNAADANPSTGTYDLACQSFGDGNQQVAAGVASWFFCTEAAVDQRFAALIDFSYDWFDYATAYVAHNDLRTRIWIWGATENDWALQADVQPSWSDGESFYNLTATVTKAACRSSSFLPSDRLACIWSGYTPMHKLTPIVDFSGGRIIDQIQRVRAIDGFRCLF
jgi:hypothetical protein